jgi:hypothetical protein
MCTLLRNPSPRPTLMRPLLQEAVQALQERVDRFKKQQAELEVVLPRAEAGEAVPVLLLLQKLVGSCEQVQV